MRFEQVKRGRKDNKVQKMIEQFLKSGYEKVEIFNEDDYEDNSKMLAAIRWVTKSYYKDQVEVSHIKGRIFLTRLDKKQETV